MKYISSISSPKSFSPKKVDVLQSETSITPQVFIFPDEKLGFDNYSFSKNKESVHIKQSVHIKECTHIKELSIKDSQSIYSAPKKIYKLRSKISSFSMQKSM